MHRFSTFKNAVTSDPVLVLLLILLTILRAYHAQSQTSLPLWTDYPMHIPVMIATGRDFVEPTGIDVFSLQTPKAPELGRFLRQEIPRLRPEDVPADLATTTPTYSWVYYHRYMYDAIGLLWRMFGISWGALAAFRIALLCIMTVAVYGIFRLALGRALSLVGTLLLFPTFFNFCTNFRDFSKAAFILTALLLLGCLIKYPVKRSRFLTLAALLGLVIGVGIGFRADVFVCLPAATFVLAACARPDAPGPRLGRCGRVGVERLAAVLLMTAVFLVTGWPILMAYHADRLSAHDLIKGLATEYDDSAGVGRASYERISLNNDAFVTYTIESHAARMRPSHEPEPNNNSNARRERFVRQILPTFPGDIVTRAYSSVLWVLRGGMLVGAPNTALDFWKGFAALWTAVALLLVARRNLRLALLLFVLLLYFGGYLSAQAAQRHGFHLAFVPLLIVGFLLDNTLSAFKKTIVLPGGGRCAFHSLWSVPRRDRMQSMGRMAAFAAVTLILLLVPLYTARAMQHRAVAELTAQCARADLEPVSVEQRPMGDWVLFQRRALDSPHSGTLDRPYKECLAGYWMAEFAGSAVPRTICLRYECRRGGNDFSVSLRVQPNSAGDTDTMRYFFPVYENTDFEKLGWSVFTGVAVPKDQVTDFKGLYRVRNDSLFPLFLNLSLPADRAAFLDHQVIFGRTPPVPNNQEAENQWVRRNPELQVPDPNSIPRTPEPDKAIERFTAALKAEENSPFLRLGLAAALDAKGDTVAALEAYRRALDTNPRLYVTYHYLDAFFKRNNDTVGRAAQWRAAAQAWPDNWLPCFHLALALEAQQDREGALEAYRRVLALKPEDTQTCKDVARLLSAKGDLDGTEMAFQRVLKLDPSDPHAMTDFGEFKMGRADYEGAAALFQAAIGLDPDLSRPHFRLIELFCQRGDGDGARKEVAACQNAGIKLPEYMLDKLRKITDSRNSP